MKKFQFTLETVLTYKDQVLDALQGEHALLMAQVHTQEALIEELQNKFNACNEEFRQAKQEGTTILEALRFEQLLQTREQEIQRAKAKLKKLEAEAEKKREEVVEAKKETSSLEKLKEKKQGDYLKAVQKDEELQLEEFVSAARARAGTERAAS
jgi:flagellar FliJ protein